MILFRRAYAKDLDRIYALALQSGVGMATLPQDKPLLSQRLAWSSESFEQGLTKPANEYYLFVLEDKDQARVIGTSGILSTTKINPPHYYFKIIKKHSYCPSLGLSTDYELLRLSKSHSAKTEICTLFLEPTYRRQQNGILLSRSRFLFMANFPERFSPTVFAELRGYFDEKAESPFFEQVIKPFIHLPISEVISLTRYTDKQFIHDLMPLTPIYISLLDKEIQKRISNPDHAGFPAMHMLLQEGFHYKGKVDLFDAGPYLEVNLHKIATLRRSRRLSISSISAEKGIHRYILANTRLDFRATINTASINIKKNTCVIDKETADLLQVHKGEPLRCIHLASG